jgi:hypothetical protein
MNRLLVALAMGLACSGCAADVEDAQPPEPEQEPQRNPPVIHSAPWDNPYDALRPGAGQLHSKLVTPILEVPPFPDPDPNAQK